MSTERPRGFEYKHIECPQESAAVDLVVNEHAKFYWELINTQTVVSKESHLEEGTFNSDNLYSVTTTERFVTMDLRRPTDIPDLQKIRELEQRYFHICAGLRNLGSSPYDNYSQPARLSGSTSFVDRQVIEFFDAFRSIPWLFTLGPLKDGFGIKGLIFSGNAWKKKRQAERSQQNERDVETFNHLKSDLEDLLHVNRELLNV